MNKYTTLIFICLFSASSVTAQNKPTKLKKTTEQIVVRMLVTGDAQGEYNFSGPIGSQISAESSDSEPICGFSSLFRKLKYRGKNSIEAWLTLDCTFAGQKSTYKTHRIYLELDKSIQKIRLPMLARNLKNVQLEFQDLAIKKSL